MVQLELPLPVIEPLRTGSVIVDLSASKFLGEIYDIVYDVDYTSIDDLACTMSKVVELVETFFMGQIYDELDL